MFDAADVIPMPGTRLPDALDFDRTVAGLADLAGGAGLAVVEADELDWTWHVRPEDLWAGIAGGVATPGQTYLAQKPEVRARIEREFFARATDPPFAFAARAAFVLASR